MGHAQSHMRRKKPASAAEIARHLRQVLDHGGAAPYAESSQRFFKEKIQARGWRTAELRRVCASFQKVLLRERDEAFLVAVADKLFRGRIIEERAAAVMLVEKSTATLGNSEFALFESWLDRVQNWDDHDALVHNVLGPMMAAKPVRVKAVMRWAKSKNRWRRRASAVALIRGVRQGMFFDQMKRVTAALGGDRDDMVEKGLGWLLREAAKADPKKTVPYLCAVRGKVSRFVLRTACETLPSAKREEVLGIR